MASQALIHDVVLVTSQHILQVFAGCLREEEEQDAFAEIYARVKAGIEAFEIQANRMERRVKPGRN